MRRRQQTFGYTEEELKILLAPMARAGAEPLGSMGTDTPIAALSTRPRLLYDYFHQLFAQVTNPPLDAIREELVTSLPATIGPEGNLLDPGPASCRQIVLPYPVIDNDELAKILSIDEDGDLPGFKAVRVSGLYRVRDGAAGIKARLTEICRHVSEAIEDGVRILVLSDRDSTADLAPIPSLLLTAAVHQHLVREQTRTQVALVVESGDCREVHHAAVLIGYGAAAVNPYLAFESVEDLIATGVLTGIEPAQGGPQLRQGARQGRPEDHVEDGHLDRRVVLRGAGLRGRRAGRRGWSSATSPAPPARSAASGWPRSRRGRRPPRPRLPGQPGRAGAPAAGGRRRVPVAARGRGAPVQPGDGVPAPARHPQRAVRRVPRGTPTRWTSWRPRPARCAACSASHGAAAGADRGGRAGHRDRQAVRHRRDVVRVDLGRGARDAGDRDEPPRRPVQHRRGRRGRRAPATTRCGASAVKQVASGRFGVTSEYLVTADDIQIKMAQGAKPGEGGQLPGYKVYPWIARTRHSSPGVGLISPPPHHDIYSIEDLAQLIHDLKNANAEARVHVKLVSEIGVGTVAAGVSKAKADVILISGHDGGTGASPLNSLKHAGTPWELGLAETQQTLLPTGCGTG